MSDINKTLNSLDEKDKKIKQFSDILDELASTEDKKKLLWKEIYQNAVNDRENAGILFTDTLMQIKGNAANHNILGPVVVKYIERMSRANDQILKLAELIAQEESKEMSMDSIYDKIGDS
mgnify:CR=1 FL=1|jgi:hypothetical protein